jgi:hypothetical protein
LQRGLVAEEEDAADWQQRMKNHCSYYSEHLKGLDAYDMWLRTSAGSKDSFEDFLCYGDQGVFGDCLDWIGAAEKWPAGDEAQEEEVEEDFADMETTSI